MCRHNAPKPPAGPCAAAEAALASGAPSRRPTAPARAVTLSRMLKVVTSTGSPAAVLAATSALHVRSSCCTRGTSCGPASCRGTQREGGGGRAGQGRAGEEGTGARGGGARRLVATKGTICVRMGRHRFSAGHRSALQSSSSPTLRAGRPAHLFHTGDVGVGTRQHRVQRGRVQGGQGPGRVSRTLHPRALGTDTGTHSPPHAHTDTV